MYFGSKGVQEVSLMKHPFLNAIFKVLSLSENKGPDIEPYVMKMAFSKYSINFKNMWDNMDLFYTMLNNLLMVLLRLYLVPKREENKRERTEALKKKEDTSHPVEIRGASILYDKISVAGLTRKRREKYYNKARNDPENKEKWETEAERSRERTFTYVHLLNSQVPSMTCNTFYRYLGF
ncbi:unnamed protein product [Rhizopus stolonifer]